MINKFETENKSTTDLLMSILLLIMFITSTDTVMFGTNINGVFLYVPRVMGIILITLVFIKKNAVFSSSFKEVFVPIILTTIILISSLINGTQLVTVLSRLISVMVGFFIVSYYSLERFIGIFDRLLYLLSIVAIFTTVAVYVFPELILSLPNITNTAGNKFVYFFVGGAMVSTIGPGLIFRSSSIFWEPGAFAIYLTFALYFQLFPLKIKSVKKILVYIAALFLTFSTTGFIAITVLFIAFIFSGNRNFRIINTKLVALTFLTVLFAVLLIGKDTFLYEMLFAKIVNSSSTSITRYASIVNGLEIALDFPFFGVAPNNMRYYMELYARKTTLFNFGGNPMNTNTVTYQFAAYGLIFGCVFSTGTFLFFKQKDESIFVSLLVFLSILLAYSGEAFFSFLPFTIMFYGFKNNAPHKRKSSHKINTLPNNSIE